MQIIQTHSSSEDRAHRKTGKGEDFEALWKTELPQNWAQLAEIPLDFVRYREYEMLAQRVVGRDVSGETCYVYHQYALPRLCSDGEEFYEVLAYYEEMRAWRLRDERWLIFRRVETGQSARPSRGFYAFSSSMPRS